MGKLEDAFNLPEMEEVQNSLNKLNEAMTNDEKEKEELNEMVDDLNNKMNSEEFNQFMDLKTNDSEMDEIAEKTMKEFENLMNLGKDVQSRDAGKIFEAASHMAKIALEAKGRKTDSKLKLFELSLRKKRLEQIQEKQDQEANGGEIQDQFMSREELVKLIKSDNEENND